MTQLAAGVQMPPRRRLMLVPLLLLLTLLSACGSGAAAPVADSTAAPPAAATSAPAATDAPTAAATSAPAATDAPAAAPSVATTASAGDATIKVVTTMSILADMVRNVGGERVSAENIIPVGAGPEDYQPTPQDAQTIGAADIVFYNGHGLEEWLADLFTSAAKPGQPQIAVSDGLAAVDVGSDDFAQGNPHFWLSAALGAKYVENIRDGLIAVDPAGKETYTANAAAYITQLQALNDELKQQAQTIPEGSRNMVTNHDAFPYFAQEYGFTIVGNVLSNPESEPSAGELAQLVQTIKAQGVKAIFSESQFNPKLAQSIADEAGVTIVANLYTDTLGESGSGGATYIDMLRFNMQTIVDALS